MRHTHHHRKTCARSARNARKALPETHLLRPQDPNSWALSSPVLCIVWFVFFFVETGRISWFDMLNRKENNVVKNKGLKTRTNPVLPEIWGRLAGAISP